jgi:hypothetical protein
MLKIIHQLGGLKAGFNNSPNAISHRVRRPKKGMSSFCGFSCSQELSSSVPPDARTHLDHP